MGASPAPLLHDRFTLTPNWSTVKDKISCWTGVLLDSFCVTALTYAGTQCLVFDVMHDDPRLARLGWGAASPSFWKGVVELQLRRVEEDQKRFLASGIGGDDEPAGAFQAALMPNGRLTADAHMLVVAIGHVLRLERRYLSITGDHRLVQARDAFDSEFPHAKDFRDILEHVDAYMIGEGNLQDDGTLERAYGFPHVELEGEEGDGEVVFWFDEFSVPLKAAARAAAGLARRLNEIYPTLTT